MNANTLTRLRLFSIICSLTLLALPIGVFVSFKTQAQDCCNPPLLPEISPRWLPGSQIKVYIDPTGFTVDELTWLREAFGEWNGIARFNLLALTSDMLNS